MAYNGQHYEELERRNKNAASRFVSCMNNTKWREVLGCVARLDLIFQIAWVRDFDWNTEGLRTVIESMIDTRGLRDPGIGGQCLYRDILWIRLPFAIHNPYWGQVPTQQPVQQLLNELAGLGTFSTERTQKYLEIRGYETRAA